MQTLYQQSLDKIKLRLSGIITDVTKNNLSIDEQKNLLLELESALKRKLKLVNKKMEQLT